MELGLCKTHDKSAAYPRLWTHGVIARIFFGTYWHIGYRSSLFDYTKIKAIAVKQKSVRSTNYGRLLRESQMQD